MATNSPFMKFIAEAASGDLTRALVKEGEQGNATREGWLKIRVTDLGGQLPLTSWTVETVDSIDYVGYGTAIALDSNEFPHISYYDDTNDALKYAYQDGGGWTVETVDTGLGLVIVNTSGIGIDSSGYPHISYFDNANDNLKYAYKDGTGWHIEIVDSVGHVGRYPDLVLDGSDYPHISYLDLTNGSVKYAYKDGAGWHFEVALGGRKTNSARGRTRIALDSGGFPHIACTVSAIGVGTVRRIEYTYKDGGGWHDNIVEATQSAVGGLALDGSDYPHISGYTYTDDDLEYWYKDGTGWHNEVVDAAGNTGWDSGLILDSDSYPHISYGNLTDGFLKYAWKDGSGWDDEVVDNAGSVGLGTDLIMNAAGNISISYYDFISSDLKYAFASPGVNYYIPIYTLSA